MKVFDLRKKRLAAKIVSYGMKKSFYTMNILYDTHLPLNDTVSVVLTDEYKIPHSLYMEKGLYALYKENICLYVGKSHRSIQYRLYRFAKELLGRSRDDESHPAAKKARIDGFITADDTLLVKHVSWNEIDLLMSNEYVDMSDIDEYVAYWTKSKYNKNVGLEYFRPKFSIETSLFDGQR